MCLKSEVSAWRFSVGKVVAVSSLLFLASTAAAGGLQPLSQEHMGAVHGKTLWTAPLSGDAIDGAGDAKDGEALSLEVLEFAAKALFPVMGVLTSDSQVQGVHFPQDSAVSVREDGALELPMPSRIERISLNNIRIPGSRHSLGNIAIHDIRFHPDSRLAVRVR